MMRKSLFPLFLFFFLVKIGPLLAQGGGCVCTNCPQPMPDNFVGDFLINVQGADNNSLADPGQGVCGVTLNFDHEYIGDLQIILTSPAGQSVTLIGPIGLWGETDGTTWNIAFVPCADVAAPDIGFTDMWNNNQAWGLLGNYFGSYYPAAGCLENFNTGPVNGTWTLNVVDGQPNDQGNFYNYEIIFCDGSGISCFSCAANAGNLLQPDLVACEGAASLNMNLTPTWVPANAQPPASSYSYTYILAQSGVIIDYLPTPNLQGLDAGNYTICGLSYLTTAAGDIPAPNGVLTVAQLTNLLNSTQAPFCGDVTQNCVNIVINDVPDDVAETEVICQNTCWGFFGQQFCNTGVYNLNLTSPQGCPFTATLNLTELPLETEAITEVICEGQCATTPGFETNCTSGSFVEIFNNPISGCDSVVTLSLQVLTVNAVIVPPGPIGCPTNQVVLSSTGSTVGGGITYLWTGPGIVPPANNPTVTVNQAGVYQLFVKKTLSGVSCTDSTSVTVVQGVLPPMPTIVGNDTICGGTTEVYSIQNIPGATNWTWTVPPGATIASGQGTNSISINWGTSAGGSVCATVANGCGDGPQGCLLVTALAAPPQPVILGNNAPCINSQQDYSVQSQPGLAYLWTVSAAGTIVSGQGTNQISVLWSGPGASGSVCISTQNDCGNSPQTCLAVALGQPPGQPDLGQIQPPCAGESFTFTITDVPTATSYLWTPPPGATITAGQGTLMATVLFSNAPGGPLCVAAVNACGTGPSDCEAAVVSNVPAPNAGTDGQTCGLTFNLSAIQSIAGSSAGWTQAAGPGMAAFSNPTSQNTQVTVNQYGSYVFRFSETNGNCSVSDSVTVIFNQTPAAGLIVPACAPTNLTYSVSFPISGGQSPWTVAGGTVITGIFTSNQIASGTGYNFTITDANGCTSAAISGSFDCNCTTFSGAMGQMLLEACEDGTVTAIAPLNAVFDIDDVASFVLHDNPGTSLGQVFAQNLTGIFGIQPGMIPGQTYYISYVVGTGLGGLPDPADGCRSVAQGTPAVFWKNPVAMAGLDRDTCGLTLVLSALPSVGFGTWAVASGPVGGTLLFADAQSAFSAVTASKSGTYNLSWEEINHGCLSSDVVILTFNEKPTASVPEVLCDATGQNFTVSFDLTGVAPFFVSNQMIAGSMFTSPPLPSGTAYNFTFTDANGCPGDPISGVKNCNCLSDAGLMLAQMLTACVGDTVQAVAPIGALPDGNDIGAFVLQDLGSALLGTVLDINTTGKFSFLPGPMVLGQTYFISYVLGNSVAGLPDLADPCLAVAAGQPVVFYGKPVANAGMDQVLCGNTVDFSGNQLGTGGWSAVDFPLGAQINFTNSSSAAGSATVSESGFYTFEWLVSQNGCTDSDTFAVNFTPPPMAVMLKKDCNPTATQFTVSFEISGGTSPYSVTGLAGNLTGTAFLSDFLPNNSAYSATITDATGCTSEISGSHNCNCQTDAGQMTLTKISACEGDSAVASFLGGQVLDSNDTLFFILHDSPVAAVGTVFQRNTEPKFAHAPPLVFGQTYFISAVATSQLANGLPDMGDPCLSVTAGQPVVFHPKPDAVMTCATTELCAGGSAAIIFNCTGDGPFTVEWSDGASTFTQNIGISGNFSKNITPSFSTTYTFFEIKDGNNPACANLLGGTIDIVVGQPATAIVKPVSEVCNNPIFGSNLDFSTLVTGGDLTGIWTDLDNSGATGTFPNLDFSGLAPGKYSFQYTTAAATQPCLQSEYLVEITIKDCQCPSVLTKAPGPICNAGGQLNLTTITLTNAPGYWEITAAPGANWPTLAGNILSANGADAGVYDLEFFLDPPPPTGCPTGSTQNLTIAQSVFSGTALAPMGFCEAEDKIFVLKNLLGGNPTAGGTWANILSNPLPTGAFSPSAGSIATKDLLPGNYVFTYKVDADDPCPDNQSQVSIFIEKNPLADAGADLVLDCLTGSGTLGGATTTVGANIAYFWKKDGQTIPQTNIKFLPIDQPGVYEISVSASPLGCSDTDEATVAVAEKPTAIFTKISEIPCFGQALGSISIESATGGTSPYLYAFDGGAFSSETFWGGLAAGFYEIKVQDANGCELIDSVEVTAPVQLSVNLGLDTLVRLGDSLTVFAEILPSQAAIDTLIWSPVLNATQAGMPLQSFAPLHTWLLSVEVFDKNGCSATDQIMVEVDPERNVFVPNAFKPGSDANGQFSIFCGKDVEKVKSLQVFDRWGEMLFENRDFQPNDPSLGWDGTRNGEKMLPGVYVWWAEILFLDGESVIYKGDVLLAR